MYCALFTNLLLGGLPPLTGNIPFLRLLGIMPMVVKHHVLHLSKGTRGPCGDNKIRGVNLGGWLVLERWMTPSVFAQVYSYFRFSLKTVFF